MNIMVYNTQHCNNYAAGGGIDFEAIARVLRDSDAEFIGLNEIRGQGLSPTYKDQAKILSELTGYEHYYFAEAFKVRGTEPYGNALLSKSRIVSAEVIGVPDVESPAYDGYYETRCLLKARLECGLTVLVIHFGLNPDEQENAVKTVLANMESEKCVLMGDFNLRPDDKIIDPIRAVMRDCATAFEGERLSYPSDKPKQKIDYIFVTPDIEVLSSDIPSVIVSDHRPHIAQISF